jgi:hypothetical protein
MLANKKSNHFPISVPNHKDKKNKQKEQKAQRFIVIIK